MSVSYSFLEYSIQHDMCGFYFFFEIQAETMYISIGKIDFLILILITVVFGIVSTILFCSLYFPAPLVMSFCL